MARVPEKAVQSLQKLREQIKTVSKRPSPKQVHSLRTRSRRVEATVHGLMLDRKPEGKRLLKAIEPVRKKAGKVRDMDVLIGFAATLSDDGEEQCLVQLIEHLGSLRLKSVQKLCKSVGAHRKQLRRHLKQCSRIVEMRSSDANDRTAAEREWSADAIATALEIWTQLSAWPQLNASNLHPFRLQVKELRYILQLATDGSGNFVSALEEVKDAIGEWHDWNELAAIEAAALHHKSKCSLRKQIRSTLKLKLNHAISITNKMRLKYQTAGTGRSPILGDTTPV